MDVVRHQCLIYEGSPAPNLGSLASLMRSELQAGKRCLYLNSPAMVAGMRSYLAARGVDVAREVEKGALVLSSDQGHLADGRFDGGRMLEMLEAAVEEALHDGYTGLWASGDMTWELGGERDYAKVLAYERGLEKLFHRLPALTGICQYHVDTLPADAVRHAFAAHRSLFLNETLSRLNPYFDLPQHADGAGEMLKWLRQGA